MNRRFPREVVRAAALTATIPKWVDGPALFPVGPHKHAASFTVVSLPWREHPGGVNVRYCACGAAKIARGKWTGGIK